MKLQLTSLLKEETVRQRLRKLTERSILENTRHREECQEIRRQYFRVQQRCPHTKTHIESGQYEPCREFCNICGMKIG